MRLPIRRSIRRVDLRSTDPDILRDVGSSAVQRTVTPSGISFGLDIAAGVGVKQWTIELTQVDEPEVRTLKLDNAHAQILRNIVEYCGEIRSPYPFTRKRCGSLKQPTLQTVLLSPAGTDSR